MYLCDSGDARLVLIIPVLLDFFFPSFRGDLGDFLFHFWGDGIRRTLPLEVDDLESGFFFGVLRKRKQVFR